VRQALIRDLAAKMSSSPVGPSKVFTPAKQLVKDVFSTFGLDIRKKRPAEGVESLDFHEACRESANAWVRSPQGATHPAVGQDREAEPAVCLVPKGGSQELRGV
jgi:hypothetical protein